MSSSTTRIAFTFGCGHDGRLGHGIHKKEQNLPVPTMLSKLHQLIPESHRIVAVRCGGYHTFVICETAVFAFGLGEQGQLGTGEFKSSKHHPTEVEFFAKHGTSKLIDILCGRYHSVAWMTDGIYVCGGNTHGQLGMGDFDDRRAFTRVDLLGDSSEHIIGVSAGSFHTVVLMSPENSKSIVSPSATNKDRITHESFHARLSTIRDIAMKQSFNLVAACGKGDFGELGYNPDDWDLLAAKEKRVKAEVGARSRHTMMGGERDSYSTSLADYTAPHATTATTTSTGAVPSHVPMKKQPEFKKQKNVVERRKEFASPTFKAVQLSREFYRREDEGGDDDDDATLTADELVAGTKPFAAPDGMLIVAISAMHHKTLMRTANGMLWEYGCYYCDKVEGKESSIPRKVEFEGGKALATSTHHRADVIVAADEKCVALCEQGKSVMIKGKGNLGLGEEDDFQEKWVELPLPQMRPEAESASAVVEHVCGTSEHIFLCCSDRRTVFCFGDNFMGQLGIGHENVVEKVEIFSSALVPSRIEPTKEATALPYSRQQHVAEAVFSPNTNPELRSVLDIATAPSTATATTDEGDDGKDKKEDNAAEIEYEWSIDDIAVGVRHTVAVVAYKRK